MQEAGAGLEVGEDPLEGAVERVGRGDGDRAIDGGGVEGVDVAGEDFGRGADGEPVGGTLHRDRPIGEDGDGGAVEDGRRRAR